MAKGDRRSLVGQLPGRVAAGVSLHQPHGPNSLSHCRSVAWNCQLPVFCGGCVVGSFWRDAACRCGCEFPRDRGGLVRGRGIERSRWTAERWWTRIRWITVRLENLPETWRGRTAALVSVLHLGHVRNGGFLRRIVRKVMRENPDAVFLAGDLYDGTAIDAAKAAEPLRALRAPQGTYFVAGNHEQFGDDSRYLQAVSSAGVRVLHNEKVDADQLQIVGVPYNHATHDEHFQKVLRLIGVDRNRASILLTHAPDRPHIAEKEGISLQVSGHTHVGQFFPWTWMARRIYRQFVYGLSRIGKMLIYTSSGAGTWGPPLRLGSSSEIVFFQFE